jgi:hypothetical protein
VSCSFVITWAAPWTPDGSPVAGATRADVDAGRSGPASMAPPERTSTPGGAAETPPPGPVGTLADRRRGWQRTEDRWTSLIPG